MSLEEYQFTALVEQGKAMLESMDPQTDAEQFMDGKLSDLEQRWTDLVSQVRVGGRGEREGGEREGGEREREGERGV